MPSENEPPISPMQALANQLVTQNQQMLDEMSRYRQEYMATAKAMEQFPYGPFKRMGEEARIIELYRTNEKARDEFRVVYNKYATAGKPTDPAKPTGDNHV
jgi:hypothetical protein